jgi:hypothetical protein
MESQPDIRLDDIVCQKSGIVAADVDGKKVMLSIEKGKYYGLDGIGSRIWELIEQPDTIRQVVAELLKEYKVEETTCRKDVLTYINILYAKGLVDID